MGHMVIQPTEDKKTPSIKVWSSKNYCCEEKDSQQFFRPTGREGGKFPDSFCKIYVVLMYIFYIYCGSASSSNPKLLQSTNLILRSVTILCG